MSNVNADATQLLTILKNMRTSISSIETTRSSVKMKYQQLGIGWNDKKYDELGTIVKDCNKALNDILQIMLQAEKYVASLAKSVQEYDIMLIWTLLLHEILSSRVCKHLMLVIRLISIALAC